MVISLHPGGILLPGLFMIVMFVMNVMISFFNLHCQVLMYPDGKRICSKHICIEVR